MSEPFATPARDGGPEEAAAFWDARLRSPECTAEDRAAFEVWRAADPAHAAAFEQLQVAFEVLRAASARPELRALRDEALRAAKRGNRWGTSIAAVLFFGFGLVVTLVALPVREEILAATGLGAPPPLPNAAAPRTYATPVGGRTTITLGDGSRVTLNTQSRIEEHFSAGRRDVTLVAGQALFEVAHDASRPFVVTAGDRKVTAIGTEFDVRLKPDGVRVVLVEGKVSVDEQPKSAIEALIGGGRKVMTAGQEYVASAKSDGLVRPADVNNAVLWRDGRVAFDDVPLTEAIAEMNRYAVGALVVADPSMVRLRVNGVFRTGETKAFVRALEAYFPVEARDQPGGDTLLVWRQ